MKKLIVLFLVLSVSSFAQTKKHFKYIAPQYPGGDKELSNYVLKYINYPAVAAQHGLSCNVDAEIYVNKNGIIKTINARGKLPEFNEEVKRALLLMPDWEPGLKNGESFDTIVKQRIVFSIEKHNVEVKGNDIEIIYYAKGAVITGTVNNSQKIEQAKVLFDEAQDLYKAKKYSEALKKYNETIQLAENNALYIYSRGVTYLNLNEKEKARKDFLDAYRHGNLEAGRAYLTLPN